MIIYAQCLLFSLTDPVGPELGVFLEPLLLTSKELVVVPVNNNQDPSSSGGSHWSVLNLLK